MILHYLILITKPESLFIFDAEKRNEQEYALEPN